MDDIFIQKRGLNYRKFQLKENKIIVETKSYSKINKYEIYFTELGFDLHYVRDNTLPGKATFWITTLIPVAIFISSYYNKTMQPGMIVFFTIVFWGFSLFNYLKEHQDDIFLVGGHKNIVFYRTKPDENEVLDYIEKVKTRMKEYYKGKLAVVDVSVHENEFKSRLNWLLAKEIITNSEKENLLTEFNLKRILE